jgi:DNA-binding PadR family transcriptional regulator
MERAEGKKLKSTFGIDWLILLLLRNANLSTIEVLEKIDPGSFSRGDCYRSSDRLRRLGLAEEVQSSDRRKPLRLTEEGDREAKAIVEMLGRFLE